MSVALKTVLEKYDCISLEEMSGIRLMKRVDKKFMLPVELLPQMLDELRYDYRVQDIGSQRIFKYATLYYDTPCYHMYHAHQNGKLNRLKVRSREYLDSNLCFLEVKKKSNKGVTLKERVMIESASVISEEQNADFLKRSAGLGAAYIEAKVWSFYKRITLVNNQKTERLTIDCELKFENTNNGKTAFLPDLVIVELKKDQYLNSPVIDCLSRMRVKSGGMSKYCLGVALTETGVKKNLFKSKINSVSKISPILI